MTDKLPEHTALYRLYDADGRLLYVGITNNPKQRWRDHEQRYSWWLEVADRRLEWHDSRREAFDAETAAMRDEHPMFNSPDRFGRGRNPSRRPVYDDSVIVQAVAASLRQSITSGELTIGTIIRVGKVAKAHGASIDSTGRALGKLVNEKLLSREGAGWFKVVGKPQ
jgi:predicted GIY-YIG superfamily endonuclease